MSDKVDIQEKIDKSDSIKVAKKPGNKKKSFGIIVFLVGITTLVAGVVFLLINFFKATDVRDAEYLVQIGTWQLEDESAVVWDFTEVGKGTLTTNSYTNSYDFIWAIEGNRLKVETNWLYAINNEYVYELNQNNNKLILMGENDETFTFVPAPKQIEENEETN